jgi:hypothetical protein
MDPGLNDSAGSRHNSVKDSKRASFANKDSFKSHEGRENHDGGSEQESCGGVAEQEVSPRIPRKFIANWRQACDRTKDRTKELLKRWRTLPESEIANAAAAARAQQQGKDHGWSVHVWGESDRSNRTKQLSASNRECCIAFVLYFLHFYFLLCIIPSSLLCFFIYPFLASSHFVVLEIFRSTVQLNSSLSALRIFVLR